MSLAPVFKTQMSPFDQMAVVKRITKGDHKAGVCSGLCLLWLRQKFADRMALSSTRVAYLRGHLEDAGELQTKRDSIPFDRTSKRPEELIKFFDDERIEVYAWLPSGGGWLNLGDDKPFQPFIVPMGKIQDQYPLYFVFSLRVNIVGPHMWTGEMANDGVRVFDPNHGEFWARDPPTVLDGLYDLYKEQNNLIRNAQCLLVRPKS